MNDKIIMSKVRDIRFDTLKGFLILCVLYRHFFACDISVPSGSVETFIHFFTMPLFVFVSGYFTRHVDDEKKYWNGILGIFETYVVFQIIKGILYHYSLIEIFSIPTPMLWYMLALILWRIAYFILYKLKVKICWRLIVIFVVVALLAGFTPYIGRPFAISRFLYFSPYFFLGVLTQSANIIDWIGKYVKFSVASLILILTMCCSVYLVISHDMYVADIFRGGESYPQLNPLLFMFARLGSYLVSFIISIAIIRVFAFPNNLLAIIGKDSLKLYMFHGFGVMAMNGLNLPKSFVLVLLYATIVTICIYFFDKTKLSDYVLRPVKHTFNYFRSNK